ALTREKPSAIVAALLDAPPYFFDLDLFARDRALGEAVTAQLSADVIRILPETGTIVMAPARWLRLRQKMLDDLEAYHAEIPDQPGVGMERLRMMGEIRPPAPIYRTILQGLQRQNVISLDGAWVRLASHVVRFSPEDGALWRQIEPHLT